MIKYWKSTEKAGEWRQTEDDPATLNKLLTEHVVRHMTVLSVDRPVTKETPRNVIKYFGDMYFDIDFKPEEVGGTYEDAIEKAIESCRELVSKLATTGATGLQIYASGSKGFHVMLPWQNFGNLKPQTYLYDTYRQIAVQFKVEGLDMAVYRGGKGGTLRMPNVKRDKGTYKVPLTVDELNTLTPEGYVRLISARRVEFMFDTPSRSDAMAAILVMAKNEAARIRKEREKLSEANPKEDLAADYKENGLPGCIERLVTYGDERDGSNFNQACLQLAVYMKDAGLDRKTSDELCHRMAGSVNSSAYKTKSDRFDAITALRDSIAGTHYHFSKGPLFAVVNRCGKCSICSTKKEVQGGAVLEIDERLQIGIGSKGYELGFGKAIMPATNFHLSTKAVKVMYPVDWHSTPHLRKDHRRPAGLILEMTIHDSLGANDPVEISMSEEAVNSPLTARDVLVAAGGSWLVPPDFWNKLRMVLTDRGNLKAMNAEEITVVPHFGISLFLRDAEYVTVYCDPEAHLLSDPELKEVFRTEFPDDPKRLKIKNSRARMPNLAHIPPFSRKMEREARGFSARDLEELINHLTCVLPDGQCAITLGWFCAAHIKPYLRARGVNFTLLNLYGPPESGKTAAASLMLCLHGVFSSSDAPVVDVSQSTLPSVHEKLTQSNSVPCIVDEFNQGTIGYQKYQAIVVLLKSAWDHNVSSKMIGKSEIRDMVATTPIITCGEEPIGAEHRALRTRALEIAFNPAWKDDERRRIHFGYTSARKPQLASFGLDMLVEAVQGVDYEWVGEKFEAAIAKVPKVMGSDRKREGYASCLVGLDLLERTLTRLGADCSNRLRQLREALIQNIQDMDSGVIETSTDRVVRRIVWGINNFITEIDPEGPKVPPSIGLYQASEDEIRFHPILAYSLMRRSDREDGRSVFKLQPEDFDKMLRTSTPDYIRFKDDGNAYIAMEELMARGWWINKEPVGMGEEF